MGKYLNPDNEQFAKLIKSKKYVDKTGLIKYLNGRIGEEKNLIASSRPRRFGKTLAVRMLVAYYSKGCDSRGLFKGLEIEGDPSFEEHLNKCDVICLDIQWMKTSAKPAIKMGEVPDVIAYIHREVIKELRNEYPELVADGAISLPVVLADINAKTKKQFVFIIDEWDCLFREDKGNAVLQEDYVDFLRSLFKGSGPDAFVKLAYITGILPIKKYDTESALNNFLELTMIAPDGIAPYVGFTEGEVRMLCEQNRIPFAKMQKWYDGYVFDLAEDTEAGGSEEKPTLLHVYSPNSVMEAVIRHKVDNYWTETGAGESLKLYIGMDFDGLRQKVMDMLGGTRCKIDVEAFQNDMTSFEDADDVLTLLIHLGYLAYDSRTHEAFIPNEEVRSTFIKSVKTKGWGDVYDAINDSEKLLKATLSMDEKTVAKMIGDVHRKYSSSLVYNNEISLASVVQVAYYSAMKDYTLVRELPTGEGFADMAFIPKRKSEKPAILVELKWDSSAEGAIAQIKGRKYAEGLGEYQGNMLLVGINYDKKTKEHQCRIEKA